MLIKVKELKIKCDCGGEIKNEVTVGLSTMKELIIQGRCNQCLEIVLSQISLLELQMLCPTKKEHNGEC